MKYNNIFFLLVIASFFNSCKEAKESDLERFNLNGKVKVVNYIYKEASEKFGKVIDGKIIADSLVTLKFNEKGQLTDSTWNNHKYLKKIEYDNKLRKRETCYHNKSIISFKEFLYNTDGKISEKTNYDKSKKIIRKEIYKNQGNLTIVKIYNTNGDLVGSEILNYDSNGNLIKIKTANRITTFKYSDNIIIEKTETETEYEEKDINLYDDFSSTETYKETFIKKNNYDINGNIFKYCEIQRETQVVPVGHSEPCLFHSETILNYDYQNYDKFKNWTKKIVKREFYVDHIIERKISYRKDN
ncbi:hypothetical protein [Flavobacterium sp.]|jgi:hypothetical protein|uniref:hypothetical protein n=1 Tax=Flavobacterium sp. TaxID=239 RepID=UPI0037BFEEDB